jgi:S-adenosylmethionine:tRNA ribosyltransferase-isomerase
VHLKVNDFDYSLPSNRIAQRPLANRADSRLLLVDRAGGGREDRAFRELPTLLRGDELMVVNNTRVLPARLFGRRRGVRAGRPGKRPAAGGEFLRAEIEVLLTREVQPLVWEALVRPGRKVREGEVVVFGQGGLEAEVISRGEYGSRTLRFASAGDFPALLEQLGHMPLPPYIDRLDEPADRERYQTLFASRPGAVAAPTAALHFDQAVLAALSQRGVERCEITLHVGLGTFQPIHKEEIEEHQMHSEACEISEQAAEQVRKAKREGRPVLAVGTTVVRALEDSAARYGEVRSGRAEASIFIRPGHSFRVVDQLLTNFHLPKSSLLILVAAFAGREHILAAYRHAVEEGYRFYSYGDCMLIR